MGKTVGIALVAIVAVLGIGYLFAMVSTQNQEVRLRNQFAAQKSTCEAFYDTMWKILQQKAQVSSEYKNSFAEIYPKLMEGRYGNARGGALMSWISESNPNFDIGLYKDLSVAIEAQRTSFFNEQKKLLDLDRQHENMRGTWPTSLWVGNRPKFEYKIITSEKTGEVYQSGQENDVDLFKKEK